MLVKPSNDFDVHELYQSTTISSHVPYPKLMLPHKPFHKPRFIRIVALSAHIFLAMEYSLFYIITYKIIYFPPQS